MPGPLRSFCLFAAFFLSLTFCSAIRFTDVTARAGFSPAALTLAPKYGGACVADLDGDGWLDLILANHNDRAFVYFNRADGTLAFTESDWVLAVDAHGYSAFHLSPFDRHMHFTVSRGGFLATRPNPPLLYTVSRDRVITQVHSSSNRSLFADAAGRGRTMLPVHLSSGRALRTPDLLFMNARLPAYSTEHNRVLSLSSRNPLAFTRHGPDELSPLRLHQDTNHYATVTDMRNRTDTLDAGLLDVVTFHSLRVYRRMRKDFTLRDVTSRVLPRKWQNARGVRAVAELDYDGDGLWDLYVVRSVNNDLKWLRPPQRRPVLTDGLLRCVPGRNGVGYRYVDVTKRAGISGLALSSEGVTTADFDNDGHVDVFLTQAVGPDVVLRNRGDGTFERISLTDGDENGNKLNYFDANGTRWQAGQPTAADFDRDGRVDIINSRGDWFNSFAHGTYAVLRNTMPTRHNWLLVRVKSAPAKRVSSLHAVVTVCTAQPAATPSTINSTEPETQPQLQRCQRRRVGSPGTAVSPSYIELVHFGLGNATVVRSVTVTWVNGASRTKTNVKVNGLVGLGV